MEDQPTFNTKGFVGDMSVHGLPRLVREGSTVRRLLWCLVFLGSFAFMLYQIWMLINTYLDHPVVVKTSVINSQQIEFPAVTVCNLNMLKRSNLQGTVYEPLVTLDNEYQDSSVANVGGGRRKRSLAKKVNMKKVRKDIVTKEMEHVGLSPETMKRFRDINGMDAQRENLDISKSLSDKVKDFDDDKVKVMRFKRGVKDETVSPSSSPTASLIDASVSPDLLETDIVSETAKSLSPVTELSSVGSENAASKNIAVQASTDSYSSSVLFSSKTSSGVGDSDEVTVSGSEQTDAVGSSGDLSGGSSDLSGGSGGDKSQNSGVTSGSDVGESGATLGDSGQIGKSSGGGGDGVSQSGQGGQSGQSGSDQSGAYYDYSYSDVKNNFDWSNLGADYSSYQFYEDYGFKGITNDKDFEAFVSRSKTSDLSDIAGVLKPAAWEVDKYGHPADEFILQCSFDNKNCNYSDFRQTLNVYYGNCYTFNHGRNQAIRRTSKYGSRFGLRLTLNINSSEYIGLFSHSYGARVTIHPQNMSAFPEDEGISVQPGMETSIGLKMERITRKKHPHPSNCTQGEGFKLEYEGGYSYLSCRLSCLQRKLRSRCQCVDKIVSLQNGTRCNILNSTQEYCRQAVHYAYDRGTLGCDCPQSCFDLRYDTKVSSSQWPSDRYMGYMRSRMNANDLKEINKNLLRLHVYYESLYIHSIDEFPAMTPDQLWANIGGSLGLCIGLSICTVFEFFELIFDVCVYFLSRRKDRKTKPSEDTKKTSMETKLNNDDNKDTWISKFVDSK